MEQGARSEKREARSEKREARRKKGKKQGFIQLFFLFVSLPVSIFSLRSRP
jgi:hypothetical protein